jgi:hypothetical protein
MDMQLQLQLHSTSAYYPATHPHCKAEAHVQIMAHTFSFCDPTGGGCLNRPAEGWQ